MGLGQWLPENAKSAWSLATDPPRPRGIGKLRSNAEERRHILEQKRRRNVGYLFPRLRAATSFHAQQEKTFTNEDHAYNWIQTLKTYVFPVFERKPSKDRLGGYSAGIGPME
jgi:hypothetical protein